MDKIYYPKGARAGLQIPVELYNEIKDLKDKLRRRNMQIKDLKVKLQRALSGNLTLGEISDTLTHQEIKKHKNA